MSDGVESKEGYWRTRRLDRDHNVMTPCSLATEIVTDRVDLCLFSVSDFTQELSQMYEQHATELQLLVTNFRKKNIDLRKDRYEGENSAQTFWRFFKRVFTSGVGETDIFRDARLRTYDI